MEEKIFGQYSCYLCGINFRSGDDITYISSCSKKRNYKLNLHTYCSKYLLTRIEC